MHCEAFWMQRKVNLIFNALICHRYYIYFPVILLGIWEKYIGIMNFVSFCAIYQDKDVPTSQWRIESFICFQKLDMFQSNIYEK